LGRGDLNKVVTLSDSLSLALSRKERGFSFVWTSDLHVLRSIAIVIGFVDMMLLDFNAT
jgi:hypothetical protein